MRFMIMVLMTPEADQAARLPSAEEFVEMGRYQEEMVQAGVLMAGEGLRPRRSARASSSSVAAGRRR